MGIWQICPGDTRIYKMYSLLMCVILDVDDDETYELNLQNKNDLSDYMKQHVSCVKKGKSKKKVNTPKSSDHYMRKGNS